MLKSIRTSEANRSVVAELTAKLGMGPENLIARIALTYSVARGRRFDISEMKDSKGKEYSSRVLFGDYVDLYVALVSQHYGLHKSDYDIPKYIKMHIDDGLSLISEAVKSNPNLPLLDFVVEQIDSGLHSLRASADSL